MTMATLMDSVRGRYRVVTESGSQYVVDLDRSVLIRMRGAAPPSPVDDDPVPSQDMRGDGRPVALVAIREATVGRPAQFVVDLEEPDVRSTVRATTPVVVIEPLD